jgi:peptidoglycan hydrolase-like protein with peptidoglycan-binding domain
MLAAKLVVLPAAVVVPTALVLAAPASASSPHLGDRTLRQGMSGHDVRVLQDYLTRVGFGTPVVGVFGPITDRNVRSFERRYHLAVNGVVDARVVRELRAVVAQHSHAALAGPGSGGAPGAGSGGTSGSSPQPVPTSSGSAPLFHRVLKQGMKGDDVNVLQDYLTRAGYPTTIDGDFGPATAQSVRSFQRDHHLTADGVVSAKVAAALQAAVATTRSISTGPVAKGRVVNGLAVAPANAPAVVRNVIAAGNKIAFKPYIYGGGHGTWNDTGYDCSGSVSYALHGANLLSAPEDSGELESYGSPGRGRWITIWANGGHVYMYVAGLRFDTSAQDSTGGSRWTTDSRSSSGFVERHPTGL